MFIVNVFISITWYSFFSPFYRNFTTPLIGKITCLPKSKRRCFFGLFKMNRWSYNHITEIHKSLDSVISDIQGFKLASSSQSDSTRHRYFIFNFTKKGISLYFFIFNFTEKKEFYIFGYYFFMPFSPFIGLRPLYRGLEDIELALWPLRLIQKKI